MHKITDETLLQGITGQYNSVFVVISIILACVASYTALSLNERLKKQSFVDRRLWIALASFALAFGIWAMHSMGMLAYELPIKIKYDLFFTSFSIVPIFLTSIFAFTIINAEIITRMKALLSSLLIALGVSSMHYFGMSAIDVDMHHVYNPNGVVLAFFCPFVAFMIVITFYHKLDRVLYRILFGILIGLSVSAAHYIMMAAMTIHVPKTLIHPTKLFPHEYATPFAIVLCAALALIIILLLIGSFMDYLLTKRVERVDTITHLSNSMQMMLDIEKHDCKQVALWIFDDIEYINKTYGYHVGDRYAKEIADRILSAVPKDVKVYRAAQHQFLLATGESGDSFYLLHQLLAKKLALPFIETTLNQEIIPQAVCAYTKDEKASNEELLKQVIAISKLPQLNYDFSIIKYDPAMHDTDVEDEIIHNIDRAMYNDELYLVYQPKLLANEQKVVGVEALLRWQHKDFGFISPGMFVPLLEQHHKMDIVTDWVIDKVCQQIADWRERGICTGPVAINIPGEYLISEQLKQCLQRTLQKYQVKPEQIELELTETSFVQNLEEAMRTVQYYNDLGFGIALDDFGTGLSSLSYLRQMKITTLKVDKAFIDHVPAYEKDVAIAKTIIGLGEALNLMVVVEGIETKEQLQFVIESCKAPIAQGYYFSKPLSVYDLEQFLKEELVKI